MIRALKLENFQNHEDMLIKFSPEVNVIVGPTDSGKSAVFRALSWLARHESVTGLPRWGTESMLVGAVIDNARISRVKDKKTYGYSMVVDGKSTKFVACGQNQPSELTSFLSLSDINFQAQHDGPFLLSLSPGKVAQELNKILDMSTLDTCVAEAKRKHNELRILQENNEKLYAQACAEQIQSEWSIEAWDDIQRLDALQQSVKQAQDDCDALATFIKQHTDLETQVTVANHKVQAIASLGKAISGIALEKENLTFRQKGLSQLVQARKMLSVPKVPDIEPAFETIEALQKRLTTSKEHVRYLSELIEEKQLRAAELAARTKALAAIETQLGNICPTCGQLRKD